MAEQSQQNEENMKKLKEMEQPAKSEQEQTEQNTSLKTLAENFKKASPVLRNDEQTEHIKHAEHIEQINPVSIIMSLKKLLNEAVGLNQVSKEKMDDFLGDLKIILELHEQMDNKMRKTILEILIRIKEQGASSKISSFEAFFLEKDLDKLNSKDLDHWNSISNITNLINKSLIATDPKFTDLLPYLMRFQIPPFETKVRRILTNTGTDAEKLTAIKHLFIGV